MCIFPFSQVEYICFILSPIKRSKRNSLVVPKRSKSKRKGKGKKDPYPRKGGNFKPSNESYSSKLGKGKKGKLKCIY
jgi:hypothetical protein